MKIKDIEIKWLGHSGFLIKNSKVIYIDPYNIKDDSEKAVTVVSKLPDQQAAIQAMQKQLNLLKEEWGKEEDEDMEEAGGEFKMLFSDIEFDIIGVNNFDSE